LSSANSLLRQCLVHGAALTAAGASSSIAWWAVGHVPSGWLIGDLLFGRTAAALAFRLDRLRWSEWGESDARLFAVAALSGTALAAALAPGLLTAAVLRVLFVEALVYGAGGLALADALRARRRKRSAHTSPYQRPCLVYGSRGDSRLLAQRLLRDSGGLRPFAYLDEDRRLEETVVDGLPVLGCLEDLVRLAEVHKIEDVVAAAPSEDLTRAAGEAGIRVHYGGGGE
jgi:FlaA1/EpsC-like NDP-sugar epimerase